MIQTFDLIAKGARSAQRHVSRSSTITVQPAIIIVECWLDLTALPSPVDIGLALELDWGAGDWRPIMSAQFVGWDNIPPVLECLFNKMIDMRNWKVRAVLNPAHPVTLIEPGLQVFLDESGVQRSP